MDGFQCNKIIVGCPHIAEKIFEGLDDQSLTTCRLVEKSWKILIDSKNYSWERIVKRRNLKHAGNTYLELLMIYSAILTCPFSQAKVPAKPGTWNPCSVDLSSWSQNKQN